jgi:hypothetical protein
MNRLSKFWKQITSIEYSVAIWRRVQFLEREITILQTHSIIFDAELAKLKSIQYRHEELMKKLPSLSDLITEKKLELRVLEEQHETLRQDIRLHKENGGSNL